MTTLKDNTKFAAEFTSVYAKGWIGDIAAKATAFKPRKHSIEVREVAGALQAFITDEGGGGTVAERLNGKEIAVALREKMPSVKRWVVRTRNTAHMLNDDGSLED